ncbi:EAL domain-containing protein [Thalassotalea ponticola]|uniref:putative bifunctional diguanylate cyclase/phosphodiesterase n=1 Tax=Thalassotalea ponticola TaxID=1523392 RepID=UPI0025B31165|nr:EAL domain-containing protein [Thalassotalea ponticola]MDN3652700.1 EAL domain-containing protein [Thalassotalea ponticola]
MSKQQLTAFNEDFKGYKVLVCDDDPTYIMLMRDTLEAEGFDVVVANDGEQAISAFMANDIDIVLLDVEMPLLSGDQVCEHIRAQEKGKDLPILMITGADDYQSISRSYNIGATDFLPKPIRWPMMGHRLRYMLRSQQAVNELKTSQQNLHYLAYYDSLTGLPNRQHFYDKLHDFIDVANEQDNKLGVLFIDLDKFKRINDTLGHNFGDKVLKKVATILDQTLAGYHGASPSSLKPQSMQVARLGGDEFTVSVDRIDDLQDLNIIAQDIIARVSKPLMIDQYEVLVTPSIGISIYPDDATSVTNLMKHADVAMYHAKQQGRSCYHYYSDSLNNLATERLQMEQALRKAVENNELQVYYQPQICTDTAKVIGAEALLRWHSKEFGYVSPATFIPVAEEIGLIAMLGEWVLENACLQTSLWQAKGYDQLKISVNVSSIQFRREGLIDHLQSVLQYSQIKPNSLRLELTESAIMNDVKDNISRLEDMKRLGVDIAIDDFGIGYSSLSYLKRFPIDTLKIDRSFIMDLAESEDDKAIVQAIVALANALQLNVIGEGVETQEQLTELKRYGVPVVQGYLFGAAVRKEEFERLLEEQYCGLQTQGIS